jgi:hypothetical protein
LSWLAVNAAACAVLSEAMSVVESPAMAVVDSTAICLGLREEMEKDIR